MQDQGPLAEVIVSWGVGNLKVARICGTFLKLNGNLNNPKRNGTKLLVLWVDKDVPKVLFLLAARSFFPLKWNLVVPVGALQFRLQLEEALASVLAVRDATA